MSKDTRKPKQCAVCGTIILVPAWNWERKKYCSRECLGIDNARRMNEIRRPPKEYAKPPVMKGRDNPRYIEPTEHLCTHCHKPFLLKPNLIHNTSRYKGNHPQFCSSQCRNDFRHTHESGENSPFWVGGPQTYRGKGWIAARSAVVERQSGICASCGKHVGKSLPVHHIKPFREFATPEKANSADNLVGLCQSCHMRLETRKTEGRRRKAVSR